ncbi:hypothetical protein NK8_50630 [Caballeronia sp. NK8]|nr:hypothetical protein NK8_50630 [Caballeronia sp. NK8]
MQNDSADSWLSDDIVIKSRECIRTHAVTEQTSARNARVHDSDASARRSFGQKVRPASVIIYTSVSPVRYGISKCCHNSVSVDGLDKKGGQKESPFSGCAYRRGYCRELISR